MIELIKTDSKRWVARNRQDNVYIIGALKDVATALEHRGISKKELLIGVEALLKNGHNVAEFGVNNTFTFSVWRAERDLFRN